jgi:hypothetical protein
VSAAAKKCRNCGAIPLRTREETAECLEALSAEADAASLAAVEAISAAAAACALVRLYVSLRFLAAEQRGLCPLCANRPERREARP